MLRKTPKTKRKSYNGKINANFYNNEIPKYSLISLFISNFD